MFATNDLRFIKIDVNSNGIANISKMYIPKKSI